MARVLMYSTGVCPYCRMAERLLDAKGVKDIEKIRVDLEPERRKEMMDKTGRRTVPQIYIGDDPRRRLRRPRRARPGRPARPAAQRIVAVASLKLEVGQLQT